MQRRAMLKSLLVGVPLAAGAAATASTAYIRETGNKTRASLEEKFDELKARFETADDRNRKLIRIALGAAALSLGLDISTLL